MRVLLYGRGLKSFSQKIDGDVLSDPTNTKLYSALKVKKIFEKKVWS